MLYIQTEAAHVTQQADHEQQRWKKLDNWAQDEGMQIQRMGNKVASKWHQSGIMTSSVG